MVYLLIYNICIISIIIIDCETAIMHRLQSVISEHTQTLVSIVECAAELDWYVYKDQGFQEKFYT